MAAIAANQPAIRDALAGRDSLSLLPQPNGILQVVTVPVSIYVHRPEILGTLSVGFLLDDALLREMKRITGSDLAFGMDGQILASTLPRDLHAVLADHLRKPRSRVRLQDEDYEALSRPLGAATGQETATSGPVALILRSRTEQLQSLEAIHTGLAATAILAVLLGLGLSFAVARTIARPLAAITDVMREVAATGDLTRKIALRQANRWDDEDARLLGTTFNTLTDSIARFQREMSQKERLTSLGRLSTVIAHEVRNPLMIIKAALHTLRDEEAPSSVVKEAITDIDEEVARLNRIVNDVLDFARPIHFELSPVDVNTLCRESATAAAKSAGGDDIRLDLDPSLRTITTDADRLRMALVNLLVNARHALNGHGGGVTPDEPRGRRPCLPRGRGSRRRHRAGRPRAHLRSLFHDQARRHRSRAADREEHRGGARRHHLGVERARPRHRNPARSASMTHRGSILLVDDEEKILKALGRALRNAGHAVVETTSPRNAQRLLAERTFDVLVVDNMMPELSGLELIREFVASTPEQERPQILMMTAHATVESAIEAMKLGALDYLQKPFEIEELLVVVRRALDHQRLRTDYRYLVSERDEQFDHYGIIGRSRSMQEVIKRAELVAETKSTVLITGETGTGKELVARAIHDRSAQRDMPLIKVNCAAIPETLLESELFGHVRGAFTGATTTKKGKFALADGGTLFLDEIGTMSPTLQSKLLRVLQEREIEPLGSERTEKIDVRVIAATNRDLRQMVADGKFQEDLFYRLNVIPIEIPPLRDRRDDIPVLVEHFVKKHAQRTGRRVERIDEGGLAGLQQYDWPGNVRELENTIERAVVLSPGPVIAARAISVLGAAAPATTGLPSLKLRQNIEWVERETIRRALENAGGVKKDAAELMGISQRALSYYLAKYRLES